jgi:hypothetical protein
MTSAWTQTKSGLRLAVNVIASFLTLLALGRGLLLFEYGRLGAKAIGGGIIAIVCVLLFLTAQRWARWFLGAFLLFTIRAFVMGILGRTVSVPSITGPRVLFAELAGLYGLVVVLTYRFVNVKPNRLDSVCLVGAVVGFVLSFMRSAAPLKPLVFTAVVLIPGFLYSLFAKKPKAESRRSRAESPIS